MGENNCQILVIVAHCAIAIKKEVEEEEVVKKKTRHFQQVNTAVPDLGQHYPVDISAPHNKCTALKYTN